MNLDFEPKLETVADQERLSVYPMEMVRRWVCLRLGMPIRKFAYHLKSGYFPAGTVQVDGELWYDDAGVQKIIDLCKARRWDRPKKK